MLSKFDMEKVHDHVNWSFLKYMLFRMGFGNRWCKWIMFSINSASFIVFMNWVRLLFLEHLEAENKKIHYLFFSLSYSWKF